MRTRKRLALRDRLAFFWFQVGLTIFGNRFSSVAMLVVVDVLSEHAKDPRVRYHAGWIARIARSGDEA